MPAFEAIASTTLSSANTTITFSSIPDTYEHLQLRMYTRDGTPGASLYNIDIRLNNDSASNYTTHNLWGNGASAVAAASISQTRIGIGWHPSSGVTSNTFAVTIVDILDYASTNKYKTARGMTGFDANGSGRVGLRSGLWLSTSAVNRVDVLGATSGTEFVAGSVFSLYGLRSA